MNSRPLLLGHRGVRGRKYSVRENTFAAFDLALQHGCDGFEFDVRLSADNCAVVCHDAKFAGITIAKASAAQLRSLPTFETVLERYADRAFLDIELKVPGLASCVLEAISKYPPRKGFVVSSFLPEVLLDLRTIAESVPLGIICETKLQLEQWPTLPAHYVMAKESLVTEKLVADVHASARKLFVWTVNKPQSMLRIGEWEVDGIISDKPDLLVATLLDST